MCTKGHAKLKIKSTDYEIETGYFFFDSNRIEAEVTPSAGYQEKVILLGEDDYLYVSHKLGMDLFLIYAKNYFVAKLSEEKTKQFLCIAEELEHIEKEQRNADSKEILFNKMEQNLYHNLIALKGTEWLFQNHKEEIVNESSHDVFLLLQSIFSTEKAIISVDEFIKGQNIQKRAVNDQLKKITGLSIKQWLNTVSVDNCKYCLRTTSLSLKEASKFLGFPDANTFEKYFKRHTGFTPTEYRNTFGGNIPNDSILP